MAYLDVITLIEAKNYLRIDDTLTEDDAQITRMINAALAYIENWTRVYVYARAKTYIMVDGFVRVYDWPINSITTPAEADMDNEQKTLYKNFCYGIETSNLVLNIGITAPENVPPELKEVGFEIIDLMYYEHETGKTVKKDLTSISVDILNRFRRFLL